MSESAYIYIPATATLPHIPPHTFPALRFSILCAKLINYYSTNEG